ncbi:hypothetical protein K458DRAFT_176607 [Lentithecium fluviatile CBS 122367]|uniref:Uncharacterized protein n=1 Tax=Lentithecium fluviatile CBS 122367 TaxID=1168545 RepID=A0A6G1JCC0_9PLEO|nr:hypothetical protein K458DRAFT_176607 [Lentithecium fluviatile CBS 122367]
MNESGVHSSERHACITLSLRIQVFIPLSVHEHTTIQPALPSFHICSRRARTRRYRISAVFSMVCVLSGVLSCCLVRRAHPNRSETRALAVYHMDHSCFEQTTGGGRSKYNGKKRTSVACLPFPRCCSALMQSLGAMRERPFVIDMKGVWKSGSDTVRRLRCHSQVPRYLPSQSHSAATQITWLAHTPLLVGFAQSSGQAGRTHSEQPDSHPTLNLLTPSLARP